MISRCSSMLVSSWVSMMLSSVVWRYLSGYSFLLSGDGHDGQFHQALSLSSQTGKSAFLQLP